jgi:hypothetical protein
MQGWPTLALWLPTSPARPGIVLAGIGRRWLTVVERRWESKI